MLVLFVTNDLGSALLYYGIFVAMLYVATARLSFVAGALGLFLVGAFAVTQVTPHVQERVDVWLDPYKHAEGSGYQILQSLYSIGARRLRRHRSRPRHRHRLRPVSRSSRT